MRKQTETKNMKNAKRCSSASAILWVLLFACGCRSSEAELRTFHVEDLCDERSEATLDVGRFRSGLLTSVAVAGDSLDCTLRLRPDGPASMVLSLYRVDLEPHETLTIEDSRGFRVALQGKVDLKVASKSFQSDGVMTLRYVKNVTRVVSRRDRIRFRFVFTQVHNAPCRQDEFKCRTGKCLPDQFVCDRHNHCGDNSDQEKCGIPKSNNNNNDLSKDRTSLLSDDVSQKRSLSIVVILGSSLLGIVVVAVSAFLIHRAVAKKKQKEAEPLPSAPPAPPTVFGRIRESFRRSRPARNPEDAEGRQSTPSMYPQMAPSGVDNPEFRIEE